MSGPIRILYVDDNPLDRELVRDALENEQGGFRVIEAASRADFETRLAEGDYDLVLSDFNILGFEGVQVLDAVHAKNPLLPVVIVTGTGSEEVAVEAMKHGAADYVIKTTKHIQRLPRTIYAVLEKKRLAEERERAEAVLRESESKYRTLVEHIPQKIFTKDRDSVYVSCNESFARDLGIKPDQFAGRTDYDFFPSELADKYRADDKRIMETGQTEELEEKYLQAGQEVWVQTIKTPIRQKDGRVIGVLGIFWDITERKQAEEALRHSYHQLQEMLTTTVNVLASTIEKRDPYTSGHQRQTTVIACAIAKEMELPEEQIEGIRMAGLIHDIGKIIVPAEILSKPGPLSEMQFNMVKTHPQAGYDILTGVTFPWPVAEIVLQHHERMDGSGYPQGFSGAEILLEARILAVADVVEAMSSHRPYRPSLGIDKALEEISQNRGVLYDPEVVDACIRLFTEKGFTFSEVDETVLPPQANK